jgi:hypothetical protein
MVGCLRTELIFLSQLFSRFLVLWLVIFRHNFDGFNVSTNKRFSLESLCCVFLIAALNFWDFANLSHLFRRWNRIAPPKASSSLTINPDDDTMDSQQQPLLFHDVKDVDESMETPYVRMPLLVAAFHFVSSLTISSRAVVFYQHKT